jgi:hypothetical protein
MMTAEAAAMMAAIRWKAPMPLSTSARDRRRAPATEMAAE